MKEYPSVNPEQYPPVYAVQVTFDNSEEVKEWVRGVGFRIYDSAPLVNSLFGVQTYNCVTQVREGDFVVWVDDWYFQVMTEVAFFERYRDADKHPPDEATQPITPPVLCQHCGDPGAETYHQRTRFVNKEDNFVTLCPVCRVENDMHWDEMWSDYYSGCM